MATAQPFDPDLHHIGIGDDPDNLWGLMIAGAYSRRGQGQSLAKVSDVGVDSLVVADRLSTWTQRNYSGGEFQRDWDDDAMFFECGHFVGNQMGLGLRSVPPIVPIDAGQGYNRVVPKGFDLIDGNLYVTFVTEAADKFRVIQYQNLSGRKPGGLKKFSAFAGPPAANPSQRGLCSGWNVITSRLWIGYSGQAGVRIFQINPTTTAGVKTGISLNETAHLNPPTDNTFPVTAIQDIQIFNPFKFVVTQHAGSHDYVRVWNHIGGGDAATKWAAVGHLPGDVVTSLIYNNQVYYLTRSFGITQLSMTNGDQVFPVLTFPYYFQGQSMVEYAGRLYVGGIGYDLEGNQRYGELFEITGTSLRLVRTFKTEADRADDARSSMRSLKALGVSEGMLWMPDDSSAGLEAYDATTDALYGASRLLRGPQVWTHGWSSDNEPSHPIPGRTFSVEDIEFTAILGVGTSLMLWGTSTNDTASGLFRVLENPDADLAYQPYLVTSEFSPEPSRLKTWSQVACLSRYASPTCLVSTDSGHSYTACPVVDHEIANTRHTTTYDLTSIPAAHGIRIKFEFQRTGAAGEAMIEMLSHSLSFAIHSSGKSGFLFRVAAVENPQPREPDEELIDEADNIREINDYLWSRFGGGNPMTFIDPDGVSRQVYLSELSEDRPVIAGDERYLNVTLLEL